MVAYSFEGTNDDIINSTLKFLSYLLYLKCKLWNIFMGPWFFRLDPLVIGLITTKDLAMNQRLFGLTMPDF